MTEWKYLPILKWKQGERIALRNLKGDQWDGVVPLIELQPISAAPNFPSLQAALPDYLDKIAKDLAKALPEGTACAIDTRYVSTGYTKQAQLLYAVSLQLGKLTDRQILPVITSRPCKIHFKPAPIADLSFAVDCGQRFRPIS